MIVGFTGTQVGMTGDQAADVYRFLLTNKAHITEAHHGDCVGADEQFHDMCMRLAIPVVIHPPEDDKKRAFCKNAMRVEQPYPYLVRNRHIVNASDVLLGTPKEVIEPAPARGQGTWSTIRYARKHRTCSVQVFWVR